MTGSPPGWGEVYHLNPTRFCPLASLTVENRTASQPGISWFPQDPEDTELHGTGKTEKTRPRVPGAQDVYTPSLSDAQEVFQQPFSDAQDDHPYLKPRWEDAYDHSKIYLLH